MRPIYPTENYGWYNFTMEIAIILKRIISTIACLLLFNTSIAICNLDFSRNYNSFGFNSTNGESEKYVSTLYLVFNKGLLIIKWKYLMSAVKLNITWCRLMARSEQIVMTMASGFKYVMFKKLSVACGQKFVM